MTEKEEKQLKQIHERISQMKAQEKAIIARNKKRQQKERTRRLIQNGTLAEKYLNCENMNPQEFERVLQQLCDEMETKKMIEQITKLLP